MQHLDRFAAMLRLADDRQREGAGAIVEKLAQTPARGRLVVDNQYTQCSFSHEEPPGPESRGKRAAARANVPWRCRDARRTRRAARRKAHSPPLRVYSCDTASGCGLRIRPWSS